jgi:hypothetical protein
MAKSLSISLFLVIAAVVAIWFLMAHKSQAPTTPNDTNTPVALSHCGLTVTTPLSGVAITSPISITAVVDNTMMQQLGCGWTVFEAQAGSYELKDANGAVLGSGVLTTTQDWMTSGPVTYTGQVASNVSLTSGMPLSLVFTEEDVADMGNPDTLTVPLIAQ